MIVKRLLLPLGCVVMSSAALAQTAPQATYAPPSYGYAPPQMAASVPPYGYAYPAPVPPAHVQPQPQAVVPAAPPARAAADESRQIDLMQMSF